MDDVREVFGGDALTASVAQVLDRAGVVVGSGFLVAEDLLITCAHVLTAGGHDRGDEVELVFPRVPGSPSVRGRVLEEGWRDPEKQDIALVRLEQAPHGTVVLPLGSAAGCAGHRVRSFGFPSQARSDGHFGSGVAVGLLPSTDRVGELLQLTGANDLTTGFSGGPVMDETTGLVVGMLTEITAPDGYDRGQAIAHATPTSVLREAWPPLDVGDLSPYRALEPFTAEHARWFRGRAEAVRRVVAAMSGGQRLVLLLGPSGSGKSSLVQAGVLPALAAGGLPGSDRWQQVIVRPGPQLPEALARIGEAPSQGSGSATGGRAERLVLVVDQFEELLTHDPTADPEVATALSGLATTIHSEAPVCIVLVMRDDFYSRLSVMAPDLLRTALETRGVLNIPATLTAGDVDAIVTGPAQDLQVPFEAGLAQRIVSDVLALNTTAAAQSEAPVTVLPMLEVALTRLWERRLDHGGRLTHDAYHRIGGVTGAVAEWCDAALRELGVQRRPLARQVLTALVRPADEALPIPAARQQRTLDELRADAGADDTSAAAEAVDEVLAVLSRHRIITTHRVRESGQSDGIEGTPVAELIHDTLIRDWTTLRDWVEDDAQFNRWRDRAQHDYRRWQNQAPDERDPQDLPSGSLLAEGTEWSAQRRVPAHLLEFLDAGRRRQQAAVRRSRRLNSVLAVFLALALLASGLALWQRQTATGAQRAAQSRQLAAQSALLTDLDPDLSSLLAVAAYRISPTAEAAGALNTAASLPLLHRLTGRVDSVAFSRDGHSLATTSMKGTARLIDVATGETTATIASITSPLTSIGPSPLTSVAFSPDGHTAATSGRRDGSVTLRDTVRKTTTTLRGDSGAVFLVAFSPDGHTLATSSVDGTVRLWDTATGKATTTLGDIKDISFSMAFSPDGHTLATSSVDGTVRLWDTATGKATTTLTGQGVGVFLLAFSPDGHALAVGSMGGAVRLWDLTSGTATATVTVDSIAVPSLAFSPDGHTLATAGGGGDRTVRLWDVATGKATATLTDRTSAVVSVAFSPDGHLASGSVDGTVRLWDVATGKATATLIGHTGTVSSVSFSPDGHTVATASTDGTVRLWRVSANTVALSGLTRTVLAVAFSPDGHTVIGGREDGTVGLWDVATGKPTTTLTGDGSAVASVEFSPDGHTVAGGHGDGTVGLWDLATGTATTLTGHTDTVASVAFSPDGRTVASASGDKDRTVRLWDVATGKATAILTSDGSGVASVEFSSDGHTVVGGREDGTVRLWDVATSRATATLTSDSSDYRKVTSVRLSPDGHTLATANGTRTVRLWDVATGKTTATLTDHTGTVTSVGFSSDGRTLLTGGRDGTVRLWDIATGRAAAALTGHAGAVLSVEFSPDEHGAAGRDGTVRQWSYTAPDTAINAICRAVARDLTREERALYLPDRADKSACP